MADSDLQIDAVALMRKLRDQIDRDVENLTEEQRREYIRFRAERFWRELARRSPADASVVAPRKPPEPARPKPEKPFDSVRMMRELRDQLDREMEHMTSEERIAFINGRADRVAGELGLPVAIDPRVAAERARAAREAKGGEFARARTA
jgi:hypothetical protein